MKNVGSLFSKLAAYGVALTVTGYVTSAQAQPQQGTAKVQAIRGSASYQEAGGSFTPLTVGKILKGGSVIKTALNSQVDLFLKQNGPVVRVTADTTLGLDKLLFEETGTEPVIDTQLNLSNGRILGNVKKMAAASKYEIKIPTGTVGIRGTEYDISASGLTRINSGSALVTLLNPAGQPTSQTTVNQGQTFNPPAGAGAPPIVIQTPPGDVGALGLQFRQLGGLAGGGLGETGITGGRAGGETGTLTRVPGSEGPEYVAPFTPNNPIGSQSPTIRESVQVDSRTTLADLVAEDGTVGFVPQRNADGTIKIVNGFAVPQRDPQGNIIRVTYEVQRDPVTGAVLFGEDGKPLALLDNTGHQITTLTTLTPTFTLPGGVITTPVITVVVEKPRPIDANNPPTEGETIPPEEIVTSQH